MTDLDTLRPEVREALDRLVYFLTGTHNHNDFYTIRAELLRLADLEKQLRDAYATQHEALQGWVQRATDAEAKLAALKARIAQSCRAYHSSFENTLDASTLYARATGVPGEETYALVKVEE